MKYEEAKTCKQHLELLKAEIEWDKPIGYQMDLELAIEAIEKQTPKKPKPHEDDEYSAKCPNCYDEVDTHWVHGGIFYCSSCGQAIDWSEEE